MAEIFLAKQQGPAGYEKSVVIKRVLSHYSSNPDFVEMFLDEARLAALLSHPSIVQMFDFGEVEGSYYLCMEFLRGEDLHTLLRLARNKNVMVPPQVAATVVAAACDALHYAHTLTNDDGKALHIIHRDISPSNIFLTYQGQVKVLDFGIARAEGKVVKTAMGVIKGKISYMAPEQARGYPLDARVDVWALGVVLHELLTGKRLFSRNSDVESFKALLDDPIPMPGDLADGIPAELNEIVGKALERNLDHRYASAKAMYDDLDDYLSSRTYMPPQSLLKSYLEELIGEAEIAAKLKGGAQSQALPAVKIAAQPGESAPRTPRPRNTPSKNVPAVKPPSNSTRAAPAPTANLRKKSLQSVPAATATVAPAPASRKEKPSETGGLSAGVIAGIGAAAVVVVAGVLYLALHKEPRMTAPPPLPRPTVEPVKPLEPPSVVELDENGVPILQPQEGELPPELEDLLDAGAETTADPTPNNAVKAPPKAAAKGTLDVNCVPWCRIFIDGKDTTRVSPAIGISVAPGKHKLKVVNTPTGIEQEKEITVKAGQTTKEVIKF
jgi:serine/threonine-protein kinase